MQEGNSVTYSRSYRGVSQDFIKVTDTVGVVVYNFLLTDDH